MLLGITLCLLLQEATSEDSCESLTLKLGSDRPDEREAAVRRLKRLGIRALPALEAASKSSDPTVSSHARQLIQVVAVRRELPDALVTEVSGLDDRLAAGGKHSWTSEFLKLVAFEDGKREHPVLTRGDLDPLAGRAIRGCEDDREKLIVCTAIRAWRLRSAIADLGNLLADPNPAVRRSAALALGSLRARQTAQLLLALASDDNLEVSLSAAGALVKMNAPEAFAMIIPFTKHDAPSVRSRAAELLGSLSAAEAGNRLKEMLSDPDPTARESAVRALIQRGDAGEARPQLIALLADKAIGVRAAATEAAGDGLVREALPQLTKSLADPHLEVREAAAAAIRKLISSLPETEQEEGLRSPDPRVRALSVLVIGDRGLGKSEVAVRSLLSDGDPQVRRTAIGACLSLRLALPSDDVVGLLKDPAAGVRSAALDYCRALNLKGEAPRILGLLSDSSPEIQRMAIRLLGDLDARETIADLSPLLKHQDPWISTTAAGALASMGNVGGESGLLNCLGNRDPSIKQYALSELARAPGPLRTKAIVRMLHDFDWQVRCSALEALRISGATECSEVIQSCVSDREPAVRRMAIQVAARLGLPGARNTIAVHLVDPDGEVRLAAASWLCHLGSIEGVSLIVEEGRSLIFLNALTEPASWTKLINTRLSGKIYCSGRSLIEKVASAASMKLVWNSADNLRPWLEEWFEFSSEGLGKDAIDVLTPICADRFGLILTGDGMHLEGRPTLESIWTKWARDKLDR